MEYLQKKDIDLYNWLEEAVSNNEDIVVISLGSVCKWQPWSINAVYKGLKNIGCRVVWSLKDEWLPIIEENHKANITIFDPSKKWVFTKNENKSLSENTPLFGTELEGQVFGTILDHQIHLNS